MQKIDGTTLDTYKIVVSNNRERFFEKSFLLADVKPNIVLEMFFLTMNNADIDFQAQDLQWRSYTTRDILLTTKQIELIEKNEFITAAFDSEYKVFIVHAAVLSIDSSDEMHLSKRAQIAHLKANEAPPKVPSKYTDFTDVFLSKLPTELPKHTRINDYAIKSVNDW